MSSDGGSSGAYSRTRARAVGDGGSINITTGLLSVTNGAQLSTNTEGEGNGGNIIVKANSLQAFSGGQVVTTSRSSGKAGNITLNVSDSVTLAGSDPTYNARFTQFGENRFSNAGSDSGLFADTSKDSTGQGGSLRVNTGQLIVQDSAEINVSSAGKGNAGNLEVKAGKLFLNQGEIRASTASGEGGNINLQVRDLILMRRDSLISAEAGGTGKGGNISINTPFIVAVPSENSDIVANAFRGTGGKITIKTSGIFGLEYRDRLTPKSDINASSEFGVDGVVEIDTPDIDPNQGLVELPVQPTQTEVVQACQPGGSQANSEFVITGRGGLPPSPTEALSSDAISVEWVSLTPEVENRSSQAVAKNPASPTPAVIVEAQGWVVDNNGEVVLTASAPTVTPHTWQSPNQCRAPQSASRL